MGATFFGRSTYSMIGAIRSLGLTSGLQLCLDAGDASSYSGSGQSWLDTSGNGYDFFRGTSSSAQGSDPTFNGSAGALTSSEYWSFDGGDFFTYDTTNETWMDNLHKDGATFTFATWCQFGGFSTNQDFVGTYTFGVSETGIRISVDSSKNWFINVRNAGTLVLTRGTDDYNSTLTTGSWFYLAMAFAEGVSFNFNCNGIPSTRTTSLDYSSPSSGAASDTMNIGAGGEGFKLLSGGRLATTSMWSRALSASEMDDLFQATRDRFGI